RHQETFSARGHAAFKGVDLTPVLPAAEAFGIDLHHGLVDGAAWLEWRGGRGLEVRAELALPQLDLAGFNASLAPATDIKTRFLLRAGNGRYEVWIPQLSGAWGGRPFDLQSIALSSGDAPDTPRPALPMLELAPLRGALIAGDALPAQLRESVATLEPSGTLRNLWRPLPARAGWGEQLRLRAELEHIAVRPWHNAPAVTGGAGYIDGGLKGGTVDLISDDFAMEFPHVYHQPLRFDHVRGRIGWRHEGDRVLVDSGAIPVSGEAGRATAQFALDLPTSGKGRPLMTLMVGLRDSAARYHERFVPYTLSPTLVDWLRRSVRGGDLPIGGFIYRGSLRSGEHDERTVQLFLAVRNGELAYQPEWPPLHHLNAAVWIDDGGARVEAPSARIFDRIVLRDIDVELQPRPGVDWLSVRGDADASDDDVLRLLRESPLQQYLGGAVDHWRWRGGVAAQLDLGFPLGQPADEGQGSSAGSQLRVDSQLGPGTLTLADQRIVLTQVRGSLNYSSDGGL